MNTVVIIGGGASGMMAAITAAEDENNRVVLIERQQRIGKKLLCTGNGRCNLTNTGAAPDNYHGEKPGFAELCLGSFTPQDTLDFFRRLGLITVTEYGGRVYPLSNSANSVLDVLRFALDKPNVELRCSCRVTEIRRRRESFCVITEDGETVDADFVIVACGGAAGAKVGGVSDGYELLKPLGHKRTALYPALVQLVTDPTYPRALKGVRAQCRISLYSGKTPLKSSAGEIQFTDNGVSGPAVFDISREAASNGRTELHLDLSGGNADIIREILTDRRKNMPELPSDELLTGIVHNRLGRILIKYASLGGKTAKVLSDEDITAIINACTDLVLPVLGTEGFDHAQVTAGGIKTGGVNPATMESLIVPHLFICGELLDVDGDCGGYNLQWAWASGQAAGRLGK